MTKERNENPASKKTLCGRLASSMDAKTVETKPVQVETPPARAASRSDLRLSTSERLRRLEDFSAA